MPALVIKTIGYAISSLSVILLGIVAWSGAAHEPLLLACLVIGMAASILGMFCRWLSYWKDHAAEAGRDLSRATRKEE